MQVKKIKSFSELLINKIFGYTFVTFEYEQTIVFWSETDEHQYFRESKQKSTAIKRWIFYVLESIT